MSFPVPDPPMALYGEWSDWRDAGHEMPGMPVSGDATTIVAGGRA